MMPIEMISTEEFHAGTRIKVLGVGGGGGNAVQHMIDRNVEGVEFVCANTDAQALSHSSAHRTIQLGSTGLGAGSKPDKGRDAAEAAVDEIRNVLDGANMVFITAGMGGGTGTGAAVSVAATGAAGMAIAGARAGRAKSSGCAPTVPGAKPQLTSWML